MPCAGHPVSLRAKSGAKNHLRSERIPDFFAIFPLSGKVPKKTRLSKRVGAKMHQQSPARIRPSFRVASRRVVVFFLKSAHFKRFKRQLPRNANFLSLISEVSEISKLLKLRCLLKAPF